MLRRQLHLPVRLSQLPLLLMKTLLVIPLLALGAGSFAQDKGAPIQRPIQVPT